VCAYLAGAEGVELGGHGLMEAAAAPGGEEEEDDHLCVYWVVDHA
jgi:hypothetical protein